MSTMLKEVYDALKEAGASEEKASAAVIAVSAYQLNRSNLATKEDISLLERATKEDLHDLKTDLAMLKVEFGIVKWFLGSIGWRGAPAHQSVLANVGAAWWLLYTAFRELHRLKQK